MVVNNFEYRMILSYVFGNEENWPYDDMDKIFSKEKNNKLVPKFEGFHVPEKYLEIAVSMMMQDLDVIIGEGDFGDETQMLLSKIICELHELHDIGEKHFH